MDQTTRFEYLLSRVKAGSATEAEALELSQMLQRPGLEDSLKAIWDNLPQATNPISPESRKQILANILASETPVIPINRYSRSRKLKAALAIAASLLLILFAGNWFFLRNANEKSNQGLSVATSKLPSTEIIPGGTRAELILGDGRAVNLDSVQNGTIAIQGNADVKNVNGRIIYVTGNEERTAPSTTYNTLRTPKGGFYQLTLSDGTKLWLNAASSLRYPVAFNDKERTVELKGEAYFEVAKDASRPFRVQVNDMAVEVKGTHFNVMAYDNENSVKTTLLEGSVQVSGTGYNALLQPGQQAKLTANNQLEVLDEVNTEQVVAWKNGYFHFDRAGLEVLMRQIERWYDVSVHYEGKIQQRSFGGKISRSSKIQDVLKILELSRVSFRIEGKNIIVSNK